MDSLLWAQLASLLWTIAWSTLRIAVDMPFALLRIASGAHGHKGVEFYEGKVTHSRRKPLQNSFKYSVRFALVNLDNAPPWFHAQAPDHLTAEGAREFAQSSGPVRLLTNPHAAGYVQNPISVYYCYSSEGDGSRLEKCIAEVTNTPWSDRVRFVFSPSGEDVPKSLHVSPFMDMKATWHLIAPPPQEHLSLTVLAQRHPKYGDLFDAHLIAKRVSGRMSGLRNEEASLMTLLRYGYMPQRTACLIYWQAVKLLWKGATFYSPPLKATREKLLEKGQTNHPLSGLGCPFQWTDVKEYPWHTD